ncbi:mechanosensitive ion channel family protein [Elongatibacter sediminis]|uniref:mechanosensitive ion channel family protein n=1 Tax=Elongatibacter sediminis TaxID=3119006 RepID=UPI00339D40E5
MKEFLLEWLNAQLPQFAGLAYATLVLLWIGLVALLIYLVTHRVALRWVAKPVRTHSGSRSHWRQVLHQNKLFGRLVLTAQAVIVKLQAEFWLADDSTLMGVIDVAAQTWIIIFCTLSIFSVLNSALAILRLNPATRTFPLRGITQSIKLVAVVLAGLLIVAALLGKSPVILLSGLGAVSAVLMLVFKDPILGLVAGLQLSANEMLSVGDWLEMPKYGADGDVIEIGLTTVKVRNWDKTITTIPTYALISDSFKNWRGMSEAGGRRIKRNLLVETGSIRFLDEEDLHRLNRAELLAPYLTAKIDEIERYNQQGKGDLSCLVNGRRLTNLGTFRAYLTAYLKAHPRIHQEMTLMVRQLQPGANGLPLEIYAFTNTTDWAEYEGIQADIFDHVFAVLPEFGLRAHELPTGSDLRLLTADRQP